MMTVDEAVTLALKRYRETCPAGALDPAVEARGILSAEPARDVVTVSICYWLEGREDPFPFFVARVDRRSGRVSLTTQPDVGFLSAASLRSEQTDSIS